MMDLVCILKILCKIATYKRYVGTWR